MPVPTNIAEGHARSTNPDFIRFPYLSLGPFRELETLLEIACEVDMYEDTSEFVLKLQGIGKMPIAYIKYPQSEKS